MTDAHALHRIADTGAPYLNVLMPGLGQLYQRRIASGVHFLVDSLLLTWMFFALPALRVPVWLLMLTIIAWSVADAIRAGRLAAAQLASARSS